jgi:hypothetical protein
MNWLRRRDKHADVAELEQARDQLEKVRRQWPDVRREVATSDAHRRRNHISEAIASLYLGGKA